MYLKDGTKLSINLFQEVPLSEKEQIYQCKNRRELVVWAYEKLKTISEQEGYEPSKYMAVSSKLDHLKNEDIKYHLACCTEAPHFSKAFWYRIKVR